MSVPARGDAHTRRLENLIYTLLHCLEDVIFPDRYACNSHSNHVLTMLTRWNESYRTNMS